ncbi:cancer-related nucleoside-triphosphatase-like [Gigantopelta aegis]|uniref:cancer-related nucleoside-triphosphatase-like n=1 Tax=Gigantopelta aegis TaxID=1735272 RepID=UPI001B88DEE5|nr:cancer-related nucleoside-triphosphatase-like [Gigantopelta aegis]
MAQSAQNVARHVILTGPPGIGKTTLIHKVCGSLKEASIPTQGFYTEEVRAGGKRTGFDVVTLDGQRAPLARVGSDTSHGGREYRVGQYSVELKSFEQTALPVLSLKKMESGHYPVFVIDEVGKMEMFSKSFIQAVGKTLSAAKTTVLATIPIPKGRPIPFVEEIRARKDAVVFTVSRENRDALLAEVFQAVKDSYKTFGS